MTKRNIDTLNLKLSQAYLGSCNRDPQESIKPETSPLIGEMKNFWWGGEVPTFTSYTSEANAENTTPKEEDYIYLTYRGLSEVIISNGWWLTDFSSTDALKLSTPKMYGRSIYADHEPQVLKELGVVSDSWWQESYTAKKSDGQDFKVPSGMNLALKIDTKLHPNIARLALMRPSPLNAVSVTVKFVWEPSHPTMTDEDFSNKQGQVINGILVRRIVSEVLMYKEVSFVTDGADWIAQQLDADGKILDPDRAAQRAEFEFSTASLSYSNVEGFQQRYTSETKNAGAKEQKATDKKTMNTIQEQLESSPELKAHVQSLLDRIQALEMAEENRIKSEKLGVREAINAALLILPEDHSLKKVFSESILNNLDLPGLNTVLESVKLEVSSLTKSAQNNSNPAGKEFPSMEALAKKIQDE